MFLTKMKPSNFWFTLKDNIKELIFVDEMSNMNLPFFPHLFLLNTQNSQDIANGLYNIFLVHNESLIVLLEEFGIK